MVGSGREMPRLGGKPRPGNIGQNGAPGGGLAADSRRSTQMRIPSVDGRDFCLGDGKRSQGGWEFQGGKPRRRGKPRPDNIGQNGAPGSPLIKIGEWLQLLNSPVPLHQRLRTGAAPTMPPTAGSRLRRGSVFPFERSMETSWLWICGPNWPMPNTVQWKP